MPASRRTCIKCKSGFVLLPGKPGLSTTCPACSVENTEMVLGKVSWDGKHQRLLEITSDDLRLAVEGGKMELCGAIRVIKTWGLTPADQACIEEYITPNRSLCLSPPHSIPIDLDWYDEHEDREPANDLFDIGIRDFDMWEGPSWSPHRFGAGETIPPPPPCIRPGPMSSGKRTRGGIAAFLFQHPRMTVTEASRALLETYARVRAVAVEAGMVIRRPPRPPKVAPMDGSRGRPAPGSWRKQVFEDRAALMGVVQNNPDCTLKEIAESLGVGKVSLWKFMHSVGMKRKPGPKPRR